MSPKLLAITMLVLFGLGFYFITPSSLTTEPIQAESAEESLAKKLWMEKMLADPSTGKIPKDARLQELSFLRNYLENLEHQIQSKSRGAIWNTRGPWNVGGRTRGMAIDIKDPNHIIAGGVSGGIWQSKDAGNTWLKVSMPQAHPGCVSISQDPRPGKSSIWYALSGEIYGTSASGGGAFYLGDGAFRSLDNGDTWEPLSSTSVGFPTKFEYAFQGGWRIVASPVDSVNACVYMATYGSIYRSRDTGNTWSVVLGNGNDSYFSDVAITSKGIVYAALSSDGALTKGFYRSEDGIHFTNITPTFLKSYDRMVIGINPNNENEVYFLGELPSDTSGGVTTYNYEGTPEYVALIKYNYLSGDGSGNGGQWMNLSANLPITSPNQFDKFNCQGGYDLLVKIQPGTNHVVIGGTNLYISTDGFTSPNNTKQIGGYGIATVLQNFVVYPNHHPDQHELFFLPNAPQKAYSVSDGGVRFTENINADNVTWKDVSLGYITSQMYTVAIDESKPYDQYILAGLQDNGNYITNSNSMKANWLMTINGDGAYNYIAPDRSYYIISTQLGNVRKVILDERGNVLARRRIDPDGYDKSMYNFINHLAVDPNTSNTLFMPIGKKLARLSDVRKIKCDNDNTKLKTGWTISTDTITTPKLSTNSAAEITFVALSKNPANIAYLGTSNREIYKVENTMSPNLTFTKLSVTRLPSNGYVSSIDIDPDDANKVLVCYSNYGINSIFYTTDGGNYWYLVGGNLEGSDNSTGANPSVRTVKILKLADGSRRYFAGTSVGLFSTDSLILASSAPDNKTVWIQESANQIGAAVVTDIKVRHQDGYVVVGTHGNGIFDSYYTGNKEPNAFVNNGTTLFPNPANEYMTYSFTVGTQQIFHAYIFDLLGRKVSCPFEGTFAPGDYSLKIETRSLTNGMYFLALFNEADKKPFVSQFIVRH
jgi:photosystem II stability/assembly factor-like uncharacterized protein